VKTYEFGPFRLDADAVILFRGTEPVTLGQRAVALLRVLVERAGVPVSKDALIEAAWPGLVVEEGNLTVQIAALRRVLGEAPGGERWIETLQRRGYRYVGPVIATEDGRRVDSVAPPPIPAFALPDKPSVAVLPFANLSGDPEQEYFADGVVEDIITKLSRFRELFVTARNSTFSYKGKSPDPRQVGKELGVRYVLEGSVRRAGSRIRVTAQLIDSLTGGHVWAEAYDRMLEDVFELQEELTASIVGTISSTIVTAEIEQLRQRRPASLSAYEGALRAKALGWEAFRKNDPMLTEQAIREANAALAMDPNSVQALCALAQAHWQQFYFKSTADPDAAWQAGYDAASRAIELDPTNEEGYRRKAQLCLNKPEHLDESLLNARRACELNENNASALNYLGLCEVKRGELLAAIEHFTRSMRISPRDPLKPNSGLAFAYFLAKDYAAALEQAQVAASEAPSSSLPMALAAASHVGLNQLDKARAAADRLRRIAPNFLATFAVLVQGHRNPEHRLRLTTFINVACGTEEPAAADAIR
jgi:TolB-like protein